MSTQHFPVPFKIKLQDGTDDTVTVRELDVIDLYQFIEYASQNRTPDLVALCTGKSIDFFRRLDRKTYGKIAAKCIELNFKGAIELTADDPIAGSMIVPLLARLHGAGSIGATLKASVSVPVPSESVAASGNVLSEIHPQDSAPLSKSENE